MLNAAFMKYFIIPGIIGHFIHEKSDRYMPKSFYVRNIPWMDWGWEETKNRLKYSR